MSPDRSVDGGFLTSLMRGWRRAVVAILAVSILLALTLWLGRDLPRRLVEDRLASMLDAEVRLGRLEIDNLHHFVLLRVEVQEVKWESRLGRLAIDRIDVEAPIREALNGRYEKLTIDGVSVRLLPPSRPAKPSPESTLHAGAIEIRRGGLLAISGDRETRLEFGATFANWGIDPTGHVSITAERFDPMVLLGVFGGPAQEPGGWQREAFHALHATAVMLRLEADLDDGPELLRVEAEANRIRLQYGERTLELRQPRLEATVARDDPDNALRLRLRPTVFGIEAASLEAVLDDETYALRSGHAELQGMEIATLLDSADSLPDRWTAAGRADLRLHTDDGQAFTYQLDGRLTRVELPVAAGNLRSEEIQATVRGDWTGNAEARDLKRLSYELDATLGTLRIVTGPTELSVIGGQIRSVGEFDTTGNGDLQARMTLPQGSGHHDSMPLPEDAFPMEASLDGTLGFTAAPTFRGTTSVFSPGVGRLKTRGRTVFEASRPLVDWHWDWTDAPELRALRRTASQFGLGLLSSEVDVRGYPTATGSLNGPLADPVVQGRLMIEEFEVSSTDDSTIAAVGNLTLDRARASAGFLRRTDGGGHIDFDHLEIDGLLTLGSADRADAESWIRPLVATATGWTDLGTGELRLEGARIDIERLGQVQINGRLEADRSLLLAARLEPVDLSEIRELAHLWLEDPAPDYALRGTAASRLDAQRTSEGDWHTTGEVDLIGTGFGSRDGARVLEGADAHWTFALASLPAGSIEGEATATLTGPVLLWGTLFGDFSRLGSEIQVHARRDGDRWETTAEWGLPHGVAVRGRLAAEPVVSRSPQNALVAPDPHPHRVDYGVSVNLPDLTAFLDHYVRLPFEGSVEHLDTLGAAGRLRVDLAGVVDGTRREVEGTIDATDASFSGVQGATAIEGLTLALPVSLTWERDTAGIDSLVTGSERTGSLAYERLRLSGLEFPPLDTRLIVAGDTIRLDRPLNLSLLDGHVELQQVALARWSRPDRDLSFTLRLDELSLAALTRALDTVPLEGTLSGTFPAVHLTPDRLQVDGGGAIQVFGGTVEVFDISGQDILSRFPKLQFSARLDGLHLLDVTRTFDFGEVYGVVNGEIRDCELFGGVPVRCEATLGSVKTKGVPQKISVKAIRNISILGAGSHVGILDRGLQKFLDTYTYSRLGFTLKLDRDRFLLRGTERRRQHELFVRGRLPFRIDIVNAAPGKTVSFQTMMSRLQNLQVQAPSKKAPKTTPVR